MATKARLKEHYTSTVIPSLVKEFGYKNVMAVPKLEKISINMGMGEATSNSKVIDGAFCRACPVHMYTCRSRRTGL